MEDLVTQFADIYRGRRVLITGHTGFKGSWMSLWLQALGAEVLGMSLPPEAVPNHWDMLGLDVESLAVDLRDEEQVREAVIRLQPEVVFHLGAQPLVRRSYKNAQSNWATNVMGSVNLLEACREVERLKAVVVITSDKCYENREWVWPYRETDALGGRDPYSASKAAVELVVSSYRRSVFAAQGNPLLATARAGNAVGGGDWSEDRLIPDIIRAIANKVPLDIRFPQATRPWQYVLECLSGYLLLGQKLIEGERACADAWNFGSEQQNNRQVREVLEMFRQQWGGEDGFTWSEGNPLLHEASRLLLDSSKARSELQWRPVYSFEETIEATCDWYKSWLDGEVVRTREQLASYIALAAEREVAWAVRDT